MTANRLDSFSTRSTLTVDGKAYDYFSLPKAEAAGLEGVSQLPFSLKVLLENLLRYEDGRSVTDADVKALVAWVKDRKSDHEIAYRPARVLMQDFTGVPAVVDLAAMRDATTSLGGDPGTLVIILILLCVTSLLLAAAVAAATCRSSQPARHEALLQELRSL